MVRFHIPEVFFAISLSVLLQSTQLSIPKFENHLKLPLLFPRISMSFSKLSRLTWRLNRFNISDVLAFL